MADIKDMNDTRLNDGQLENVSGGSGQMDELAKDMMAYAQDPANVDQQTNGIFGKLFLIFKKFGFKMKII